MEALIPQAAKASARESYFVAEGSSDGAMDALVAQLRTGDPLDAKAETRLIKGKWRRD